ncbi:MAG: DUF1631 family protein [Planctomycetes bacterium]|nr:DUF1631 family protein [Planctomycetota bacterium]
MGSADLASVMQGTSAFDALLAKCRDVASGQLDEAISAMLAKADEALAERITKTQDREQQKRLQEARELARTKGPELEKQFHQRFLGEFQQRSNKARQIGGGFADADLSSMELSLVADEDLAETLKFNELAAKLRRLCEDEVNALDQRVGVLLGDADLQPEANPLSPNAICDAWKHACQAVFEGAEMRAVFLELFDALVLEAVRPAYEALNDLLVQNSILPKIRYGAPKKEHKKKRKKKDDDDSDDEAGGQDIFAVLQKLAASQGGGGGSGVGGDPLVQGAELLNSLTQLQLDGLAALGAGATLPTGPVTGTTNVLHELKSSQVGAAMGQVDAMTLDVVAMLFDQLFDDPKIPLGAKGLIGRMQIPVLKVAIADKTFFQRKDHPARNLLDTLGEIAIRLPADFNTGSALFGHLETIIQGLISEYKDDVETFTLVREQLVALMAREDRRIEEEARAAAERIIQEEALSVAKSVAQAEMSARLQAANLPGAVLEFLIEHWLRLMMLIHVKRGPDSEPWKRSLEVMDQLIWSVQPKEGAEERRKLMVAIPPLLKSLAAGLTAAGAAEEVREAFFPDLMRIHTTILSASPKGEAAPAAPEAPAKALDFTAPITIRNPFGEGTVQVSGADADLAGSGSFGRRRWDPTNPDNLKVGDWLEFRDPAAQAAEAGAPPKPARPARLIFVTPRKTRYIFCDRGEKDYIECTRSEIERRLRAGEAVVMEEEPEVPFFERIMGGVMGKLKGKAA